MAEIINYPMGDCAFCKRPITLIQPLDKFEPYYTCDCEGWKQKNPPEEMFLQDKIN